MLIIQSYRNLHKFLLVKLYILLIEYYHYNVKIYKSSKELDDYTTSDKYGDPNYPRVCFGVIFNESKTNVYDYELRFNSSGMINNEVPPTNFVEIDPIKYEDLEKSDSYLKSGMLTV